MRYLSLALCCVSVVLADAQVPTQGEEEKYGSFFVSGEFLFLRPDQTGMTYCVTTDSLALLGEKSQEESQESRWGPGFRIGAGFTFTNPSCDVSASWMSFHHKAHSSVSGPFIVGTQLLGPNNATPGGGSLADAGPARSQWNMLLDLVELDFAYMIRFQDRFSLRPYIGVTGGRIDQKQTIKYDQFRDLSNGGLLFDAEIQQKNHFHGAGPKLGMGGKFCMGYGLGVMGSVGASFLYGWENSPVKFHVIDDPAGFTFPIFKVKYHQRRMIPMVEARLGLSWNRQILRNFAIFLSAGYEVQYFWETWRNQNSNIQNVYIAQAGRGNLVLQGWTGEIKLAF